MATATQNFGTNTALTVTNLQSLANGSYWQSAAIDNGTVKGMWLELFVTVLTTTSAAANAFGTIEIYYAGSTDGGTDFAGGASGTQGSYTPVGGSAGQLKLLDVMPCDASETTARTYKFRTKYDNIGEDFAIVIKNNSGQALGATTNAVEYRIHKYDSA